MQMCNINLLTTASKQNKDLLQHIQKQTLLVGGDNRIKYRIYMLLRKTASSKPEPNKLQELIEYIRTLPSNHTPNNQPSLLNSPPLTQYFTNLQHVVSSNSLITHQRLQTINDGLYILIRGQVNYSLDHCYSTNHSLDHCYSTNHSPAATRTSWNKSSAISCIIKEPLWVFECHFKNCVALQETLLIRIKEDQAMTSKFYQLYNRRTELYQNQYLSTDTQMALRAHGKIYQFDIIGDKVFEADLKLHSNFTLKAYSYRQQVCLPDQYIGVVAQGKVKLKHPVSKMQQFGKYGVLLPHLTYQVVSAQLLVMLVQNDETVTLHVDITSHSGKENHNIQHKPTKEGMCLRNHKKTHPKICSVLPREQFKRRQKNLTRIAKQSEIYSIISTHLSHQSLSFARKYNQSNQTRVKKQERMKNPKFLFETHQEKCPKHYISYLASPCQEDSCNISISNNKLNTNFGSNTNSNSMPNSNPNSSGNTTINSNTNAKGSTHANKNYTNANNNYTNANTSNNISSANARYKMSSQAQRLSLLRRLRWPVEAYQQQLLKQKQGRKYVTKQGMSKDDVRWQQEESQGFVRYNLDSLQKQ